MQEFSFHRPTSLAEALSTLRGCSDGKVLSGGQSYLPLLKLDLANPSDLVSLAGVPELRGVRVQGAQLTIGAAETHAAVHASPEVNQAIPALAKLAGGIGDAQVRNRGTLGGSLAHADPAADYPAAVLALGATIVTDRREIPADQFFTGLFTTALQPDEIIRHVVFAVPQRGFYMKFAHPASKYAVVGVFAAQHADGVRVGVTGAYVCAIRWSDAEGALSANWSAAPLANVQVPQANLQYDDPDFSAAYRAHLLRVLLKRGVAST